MQEIISSILQAEELAEQLIADATAKSVEIHNRAEEESENFKKQTRAKFGLEKATALKDAESKADEKYAGIMLDAEKEVKALEDACRDKTNQIAKNIVDGLIK
ncbi:MAG: hypothetical protein E7369_01765 [Clostridiales bacterium]|nr:hypothetical protein [Clostridiales bacterium]